MRDKQLKVIRSEVGIDAGALPGADIKKLCQYVLNAIALENPRIAAADARDCGLAITLQTT